MLISQGVKRKRSQPATTSSRCREVHIFLRRGDEGSARPFQHARTLHDVAIVPLAMASARWASPTPDNSLSQRPRTGLPLAPKTLDAQRLLTSPEVSLDGASTRSCRRVYSLKRLTYAAINEGRFNGRRVPNRPIPANLRKFLWMYGFDRFSKTP